MLRILFGLLVIFFLPLNLAHAEQLQRINDVEVHYSAFPSTFLTPKIATHYQLQRSRYSAILNITLLDTTKKKAAITGQLTGYAQNVLGQRKTLHFKEVKEGKAIYYLAQVRHSTEEKLTFHIQVHTPQSQGTLVFKQNFYAEP